MRVEILLTTVAILAGCAGPNMAERSYARIQEAEKMWGPASQWTERQTEVFRQMQMVAQAEEAQSQARKAAVATAIGNGLKSAGDSIAGAQTDPFILYKMKANRQQADASSGVSSVVPDGNGGYIVWKSGGGSAHLIPDGNGGFTVWNH